MVCGVTIVVKTAYSLYGESTVSYQNNSNLSSDYAICSLPRVNGLRSE